MRTSRRFVCRRPGRSARSLVALLTCSSLIMAGPTAGMAAAQDGGDARSSLRIGVVALAQAISAVAQTPDLVEPLPFTRTSLADVLDLDAELASDLPAALEGADLETALESLPGIDDVVVEEEGSVRRATFGYTRSVEDHVLELAHDDGDLRFGQGGVAGALDVTLATDPAHPFVVEFDDDQPDPLLEVALVGRPEMILDVDVRTSDLAPFGARQGFTRIDVTGGHYRIHRERVVTMRDPDGRGVLTLEDLRYSTLPDLFAVTPVASAEDVVDVRFDIGLPDSLGGGDDAQRSGALTVVDTPEGAIWPTAEDATEDYGAALEAATGLSVVDGVGALAKYTGATLALQSAAAVPFPNLDGDTSDLFAPGDQLLDLLSTSAVAQIRCGAAPGNPPVGLAGPGDSVHCSATTADGLDDVSSVSWTTNDGGTVASGPEDQAAAVGPAPTSTVRIDGSDGEPDVTVTITLASGRTLSARSVPRTVQDVVERIAGLNDSSDAVATLDLAAERLDVGVGLQQPTTSASLGLGNPSAFGALVGLTGLGAGAGEAGRATATATNASYDVGFGISTAPVDRDRGESRPTVLLPADDSLVRIEDLDATPPDTVTDLAARIGFLGVTADLTELELGRATGTSQVVELARVGSGPIALDELLNQAGALDPDAVSLTSHLTAGIGFTATESPLEGDTYATGADGPAAGAAAIAWAPGQLPAVTLDDGYEQLQVFDPVPAAFLSGTASVVSDEVGDTVRVEVDLPDGASLHDELNVAPPAGGEDAPEVARRLVAGGPACQNVLVENETTLTCPGLAPGGTAAFDDGEQVQLIVLGDPFALRDGVIEGFAATLAGFDRLDGDNRDEGLSDDQYTSTLPLVDLRPAQLAVEREALAAGLDALAAAAVEDEGGSGDAHPPVSSAQELLAAVPQLVDLPSSSLAYDLGSDRLGVSMTATTPSGTTLHAPLRFTANGPGQVGSESDFEVGVTSTTTLGIDVTVDTARPAVDDTTTTRSRATMALGDKLTGEAFRAGVGDVESAGGSRAALDVVVETAYVPDADGGSLQTTRSSPGVDDADAEPTVVAAVADLEIGTSEPLHFHAEATDSSGGDGAEQPAPEAMEVRYVAEGLDGLAAALEQATDGAAPRNLTADGAPVSAPLIGTDLDAGAEVSQVLRTLTSRLRTELAEVTADTAEDLPKQLEEAMVAAIGTTDGLDPIDDADAEAEVTCTGDECETCTTPEGDGEPECTSAGPTGWETVRVSTTLAGMEQTGEIPFDTGLPALAVRSDELVETTTSWTLPITLELVRGVGPRIRVADDDVLRIDASATMPDDLKAIVGYLPAELSAPEADRSTVTQVTIAPEPGTYDLFALHDGALRAQPGFEEPDSGATDGLELDFATLEDLGSPLELKGKIRIPWTWDGGYGDVTYDDVTMDVGAVAATAARPFEVVDPYLGPIRDVIDVLRAPIPGLSELAALGGGPDGEPGTEDDEDPLTLLSLLETVSGETQNPTLTLAYNVISLVDGVASLVSGLGGLTAEEVPLEDVEALGAALTVEPRELLVYEKCTQTVRGRATTSTRTGKPTCPTVDELAKRQTSRGVQSQTTQSNRRGVRAALDRNVGRTMKEVTASVPGFSLPFLADPDQIMDMLTGEGEASYFRLDLGTLAASISYTQTFGPIMAGPVPVSPFIGGSIGVEGRLAMGFDSRPQTLAVESLPHPGDVGALIEAYDGLEVVDEGFYLDDLDADGVDVPEAKLVATIEGGAGVSIGIVSAGLKLGATITIGLNLNDPDDDGRLRAAEIREVFDDRAQCIFDVKGELEAFIAIFVRIWVLKAPLEYQFDLLRLGPYTLFEYSCGDQIPSLVDMEDDTLVLTSGRRSTQRLSGATDVSDAYEVRQFDTGGGAAAGGTTTYEVAAFGRVQRVRVEPADSGYDVTIHHSGVSLATSVREKVTVDDLPTFAADGGEADDRLSFLAGETVDDQQSVVTTPFTTSISALTGGPGDDVLVTGAGDDIGVDGGTGNDSIDLGAGDDTASGGDGDDTIGGGVGQDDLSGGAGNDRLEGGPGADRADGGPGDDGVVGGPGQDVRAVLVLPEGSGDDVVANQVRLGFDSGDLLVGGFGTDVVDGGDGSDVVVGGAGRYVEDGELRSLTTDDIADQFADGTREVNVLEQGNTNPGTRTVDVVTAVVPDEARLDGLCWSGDDGGGAAGTDMVTGGPEADIVIGGDGADRLDGGGGPDEVCGRGGDDSLSGDGGARDPGSNDDVMRGGTGDDVLDGGAGRDVMFGDDVRLVRDGVRVLDGSLGTDPEVVTAAGSGQDHLEGGPGDDILSGGGGADLVLGGDGHDDASGEGRDTVDTGGSAPPLEDRLVACNARTRVVDGLVDLDGDLLAGSTVPGVTADDGRLAGLTVDDGVIRGPGGVGTYDGLLGSDVVVVDGRVDLDRDGTGGTGDSGVVPLASMLAPTDTNGDGDCILTGAGDDQLRGGSGSDHLGGGPGRDLGIGGDGNDLVLGSAGTDVLLGGAHHDVLVGGEGDDHLQGGDGDDRLRGNEGDDDLVGGRSIARAADGQDVLLGARGRDVLVAENAVLVSDAIVTTLADGGAPRWVDDADVPPAVRAGAGSSLRFDDSAVTCGTDTGRRWVTMLPADDEVGEPAQSPGTPLAYDELYGGHDCDWVFGSPGDDLVRGGQGPDVVEGGPGVDIVHGDAGDDAVVGGSSVDTTTRQPVVPSRSGAGSPDGGDTIFGDGGPDGLVGRDLVLGDNATVNRVPGLTASSFTRSYSTFLPSGPTFRVQLADVPGSSQQPPPTASGDDVVDGGGAPGTGDVVFGQGGSDVITTGDGDDYVEGNHGIDEITTNAGADDVVGGSSSADGTPLGDDGRRLEESLAGSPVDTSLAAVPDALDVVDTGAGDDVILGDNGRVTRPAERWREVSLAIAASSDAAGPDRITAGPGDDRVFGQGDRDTVDAGTGDDHVEGNAAADVLVGQGGDDVLVGGTSLDPMSRTPLDDLPSSRPLADDGDELFGDAGPDGLVGDAGRDLLLGDNATVHDRGGPDRLAVQLADTAVGHAAPTGHGGDDVIVGGGRDDRLFGQQGSDTLHGEFGEDYIEGNDGTDTIEAGAGNDDVLGGSSAADGRPLGLEGDRLATSIDGLVDTSAAGVLDGVDTIDAGSGHDWVLGDNGRLTRPGGALTSGPDHSPVVQPVRDVAMADTEPGDTAGSDAVTGGAGHDVLIGQLDDGGELADGDRLFGGSGTDTLLGDLGVVTLTPAEELGEDDVLQLRDEILAERVYASGSLVPVTRVPGDPTTGGPDLLRGGPGADVLRLGGGPDLANGDDGDDVVLGGAGDDALWGGRDHDRLFGGRGADDLDLKGRPGDPSAYELARGEEDVDGLAETSNGADTIYGGWGPDELQADVGDAGPTPQSDHLVDWVGAHNVFYVCEGAYGAGRVIRQSSPAIEDLLIALVRASGGVDVEAEGSGAWYDLGLVENRDARHNNRKSPEYPGNFTCE